MSQVVIVTEGESDKQLIRELLGNPVNVTFVAAGGYSAADSVARSALVRGADKVAIVVDADSSNESMVLERRRFLTQSLRSVRPNADIRVIVIKPEIESLLFTDKKWLEEQLERPIPEVEFVRGQYEPRKVLSELLNGRSLPEFYSGLKNLVLSPPSRTESVEELRSFLDAA